MAVATKKVTELPQDIPSTNDPADSPFAQHDNEPGIPPGLGPELPRSKAETETIIKALLVTYDSIGKFVFLFAPDDGAIVLQNADSMAESWRQALDNDPKLRKKMLKTIQVTGKGDIIKTHLIVAVAIASNHRDRFTHLIKRRQTEADSTLS